MPAPLRRLAPSLVAAALTLVGCGSGGGSSSAPAPDEGVGRQDVDGPDLGAATDSPATDPLPTDVPAPTLSSEDWGDYGPFEDYAVRARESYAGSTEPAVVDASNAGQLFDLIVRGPFAGTPRAPDGDPDEFDWLEELDEIVGNGLWSTPYAEHQNHVQVTGEPEPCELGGTRELIGAERVAGERTSLVIEVRHERCTVNGADGGSYTLDGTWRRTVPARGDPVDGHFVAFDALGFARDGVEHVVDGTLHGGRRACSNGIRTRATLSIAPVAHGAALLFDDVVSEIVGAAADTETFCTVRTAPNKWHGSIAHGDFGRVEMRTPVPLSRVWGDPWGELVIDPAALPGDGSTSGIELTGTAGTSASLDVAPSDLVDSFGYSMPTTATLRVRADGETVHAARDTVLALARGSLSDLRDVDADGLPDGWELAHALDPTSSRDADSDVDGDGLTALQEHARLSDPTDPYGSPNRLSQSIEASFVAVVDPDTGTRGYAATVRGERSSARLRPADDSFTATLPGGAEWDPASLPVGCATVDDAVLRCAVPASGRREGVDRFEVGPLGFSSGGDPTLSVAAAYAPLASQLSPETAAFRTVEQSTAPRVPDFAVSAPARAFGADDETRTLVATIVQPVPAAPADVDIEIDVPERVVVRGAELVSDGPQPLISRCAVGPDRVVCSMDAVRYVDTLALSLDHRVLDGDDSELTWRLVPAGPDADPGNDVAVTRATHQGSMAPLQALIDAASDGDTVTLPAGTYAGTLDGRDLDIDVRGASGDERTVLVSTDPDAPIVTRLGERLTWSDIDWRTTGAPIADRIDENVTFADGTISPVEGAAHDVDGLVGENHGSYRLRGMRVEGFGGEAGTCRTLFAAQRSGTGYETLVYMQDNVFVDNDCDALFLSELEGGSYYGDSLVLSVDGNTFVNNPSLFELRGSADRYARVSLRNNVVVGTERLLEIDPALFSRAHQGYGSRLVVGRNLVWDSGQGSLLRSDWLSLPNVELEATDVAADPLFVDADGGDFAVRAGSPAIDVGVAPEPYRWSWDDYRHERIQPGPEATRAPVDGDGDGVAEHDVGAFEFRP